MILLQIEDFEAVATDDRFAALGDRLAGMLGLDAGPAYDWLAGSLMSLIRRTTPGFEGLCARSSRLVA